MQTKLEYLCYSESQLEQLQQTVSFGLKLCEIDLIPAEHTNKFKYAYETIKTILHKEYAQPLPIPTINLPIEKQAAYLFRRVYNTPYPYATTTNDIARFYHGLAHVCRAAIYVPVFINLYRRYNDAEALNLTEADIKLLQIAVLLHDAGREGEEVDYWDKDSGLYVFFYLKRIGVDEKKAKLLAEAVANKDVRYPYFELVIDANPPYWNPIFHSEKNIYQKVIHDADCLDIIRARDCFSATYLDFCQSIALKNNQAMDEMSQLITEARSLIEQLGDGRRRTKTAIKKTIETEDGYSLILKKIKNWPHFQILPKLYTPDHFFACTGEAIIDSTSYDPKKGLEESNMKAALREGKIFTRSVIIPSALNIKKHFTKAGQHTHESFAEIEIRKTARRIGTFTGSKKKFATKHGSPHRSVSMIGNGGGFFSTVGFLITNPNIYNIKDISAIDSDSGWGKKTVCHKKSITAEKAEKKLRQLLFSIKIGGETRIFPGYDHVSTHNEILYDADHFDAIYFSSDPNFGTLFTHFAAEPTHPYSPILQAIYLQKLLDLPIFEYSGIHNYIRLVKKEEYTDEKIPNMWATMCTDYFHRETLNNLIAILSRPIDEIKIEAMYGKKGMGHFLVKKLAPADRNYDPNLQQAVNKTIYQRFEDLIIEKLQGEKKVAADICKVYSKIPYFYNATGLNWVKRIISNDKKLYEVLAELPCWIVVLGQDTRLEFLKKLGLTWLSQIIHNQEDYQRLLHYAGQNAHDFLKDLQPSLSDWDIIHAIKISDAKRIKTFIETKPHLIDVQDKNGLTPLHWSIICGDYETVRQLIKHGANLYAKNDFGETALHLAAWYGHDEIVKYLLAQGFDPNIAAKKGKTPILGAIEFGHKEIVELLKHAGAKTQIQEIPISNILIKNVREKNLAALKALPEEAYQLDNAIKLKALRAFDFTAQGDIVILKFLLRKFKKVEFDGQDIHFIESAYNRDKKTLRLFIKHGFNQKRLIFSLLQNAIYNENFELTKKLLEVGVCPIFNSEQYTYNAFDQLLALSEYKIRIVNDHTQLFLTNAFHSFGYYFIRHQLQVHFKFFLANLDEFHFDSLQINKLNRSELTWCKKFIDTTLQNKSDYPWLNDYKEKKLIQLKEELTNQLEKTPLILSDQSATLFARHSKRTACVIPNSTLVYSRKSKQRL